MDYKKYIAVNLVLSHPHYDKEGNSYNMGTSIAEKGRTKFVIFKVPSLEHGKIQGAHYYLMFICLLFATYNPLSLYFLAGSDWTPALKNVEIMATVPCHSLLTPNYYHSFGMTENYFIFIEQPLKLDIVKMATAYMRGVSWASCMKFQTEEVSVTTDSC